MFFKFMALLVVENKYLKNAHSYKFCSSPGNLFHFCLIAQSKCQSSYWGAEMIPHDTRNQFPHTISLLSSLCTVPSTMRNLLHGKEVMSVCYTINNDEIKIGKPIPRHYFSVAETSVRQSIIQNFVRIISQQRDMKGKIFCTAEGRDVFLYVYAVALVTTRRKKMGIPLLNLNLVTS